MERSFLPGRRVDMSMVFKQLAVPSSKICPGCLISTHHEVGNDEVTCQNCGLKFSRIVKTPEQRSGEHESTSEENSLTLASREQKRVSKRSGDSETDDIREFKRVPPDRASINATASSTKPRAFFKRGSFQALPRRPAPPDLPFCFSNTSLPG